MNESRKFWEKRDPSVHCVETMVRPLSVCIRFNIAEQSKSATKRCKHTAQQRKVASKVYQVVGGGGGCVSNKQKQNRHAVPKTKTTTKPKTKTKVEEGDTREIK